MKATVSPHARAAAQALLVTFLWSTSWVLIKIGLRDMPALAFAGLRYGLAFAILLPFAFRAGIVAQWRALTRRLWAGLIGLGVVYYAVAQGAQFLGLQYLPALTLSLLLNLTIVAVALGGIPLLGERPAGGQWAGIGLALLGILIYFYPVVIPAGQEWGLLIGIASMLANAGSALLGRAVNRGGALSPLLVTTTSMGIGAALLLGVGSVTTGLPALTPGGWAIVAWLALVNTAFAFTLWNHTLRTLSAGESAMINSTMLVQIGLLAWLFLDETISWQKGLGMGCALLGVILVQIRRPAVARPPVPVGNAPGNAALER
jgi:drug/metabolite transporter (DMT)-like permease